MTRIGVYITAFGIKPHFLALVDYKATKRRVFIS